MKLEEKLVSLRKAKGLSQMKLAEKMNVSRQAISRWETGAAIPSSENLKYLSDLYSVSLDYLLSDSADAPEQNRRISNEPDGEMVTISDSADGGKKGKQKTAKWLAIVMVWETVLQSPYSVDFTEEQARYQIHEDLMQHEDGKEWALSRIGICEKPDPKFCDPFEYNEIMENENVLVRYQLRANYQARRGEKTGFWDIILVHQKPIPQVPKDMRP